jgi:hypothetical protein
MKHAGPLVLDRLEPLLEQLRRIDGLREKSRGIFYVKSRAFLHFHEDPAGLFVDLRSADGRDFDRFQFDPDTGRDELIETVKTRMGG